MARRTRNIPDLNLEPEEAKVLSTAFNLFYRPQEEPLPAGIKEFTNSLTNFIEGGATKQLLVLKLK